MDVNEILLIDIFSKRLLFRFLGGRPITETAGIILVCFDGKYTWAYKKNTKNLKSLLTNFLHGGPLKTTSGAACGPRAAGWATLIYYKRGKVSSKIFNEKGIYSPLRNAFTKDGAWEIQNNQVVSEW